nr:RxLR effector protein 19 [Phytophthora cinnamomi]
MWTSTSSPRLAALGLLVVLVLAVTTSSAMEHVGQRRLESTLEDARSLRIHFKVKRASMAMYGHSEFDAFANPVVSSDKTTVRYDGYATFMENGTNHTISMVDGIAYFITTTADGSVTAECTTSSSLALLDYIIPALNEATAISSATVDDKKVTCQSGDLFKVTLGDAIFVLCASGFSGFVVYGSDLNIIVKYLDSPVPIAAPTLSPDEARDCVAIVTPSPVTTTTLALLTGEPIAYESTTQSLARYLSHYFSYAR